MAKSVVSIFGILLVMLLVMPFLNQQNIFSNTVAMTIGPEGFSQIKDTNTYHVNGTETIANAPHTIVSADVFCDSEDRALSGGYSIFDGGVPVFPGSIIKYSFLADSTQTGWSASMLADHIGSQISAFVICSDNPPLRP